MAILTRSDWSRGVVLRSRASRAPIDLTGWALELVIKESRAAADPCLVLRSGTGGIQLDAGAVGRFIITLTAQQTSALGVGSRVFAVYRTDGGRRLCVISGRMNVQAGV